MEDISIPVIYMVVVNEEGQYSVWPERRSLPNGWKSEGQKGSKDECLAYIDKVWVDMRPLSLQKRMKESIHN